MAFLTDRTLATGVTPNDLIHIVITGDTSQNPAGSSYKATLGQFISLFTPFSGGSGNCITDFYVTNIYGCSPITIKSETRFDGSTALGILSFAQGQATSALGNYSHSQGIITTSSGSWSHAEGRSTFSIGNFSHAEGNATTSSGNSSHSEGDGTQSIGTSSHSEGLSTIASGASSHSEGRNTTSIGDYSHAEGRLSITYGLNSHAEGLQTITSGGSSHSEGRETQSIGDFSHAEGYLTQSIGGYSHTEGASTITNAIGSHAEGSGTTTYGIYSHSEGLETIAVGDFQHTQGQYNFTSSTQSAFIIGNGTSNVNRSNLMFAAGNQVDVYGNLLVTGTTSADTIVITSTPTQSTTLSEVVIRDTSSGELKKYDFTHVNFGLFSQTGSSTAVTATVTESSLIDGGVGSLSVPANGFQPGDSFRLRMGGVISAANSETLIIRVKSDSVILGSDTISFPNTSNRNWMLDVDFTIRTIGGTGVASIISNGFFSFNTGSDILGGGFVTINNTTFDTTIINNLDITAQWGSTNAGNSIYSTNFVLTKTF